MTCDQKISLLGIDLKEILTYLIMGSVNANAFNSEDFAEIKLYV